MVRGQTECQLSRAKQFVPSGRIDRTRATIWEAIIREVDEDESSGNVLSLEKEESGEAVRTLVVAAQPGKVTVNAEMCFDLAQRPLYLLARIAARSCPAW